MKISVSVSVTDMSLQIYRYRQKYRLAEYIGIGIGWTHIGQTLLLAPAISGSAHVRIQTGKPVPA